MFSSNFPFFQCTGIKKRLDLKLGNTSKLVIFDKNSTDTAEPRTWEGQTLGLRERELRNTWSPEMRNSRRRHLRTKETRQVINPRKQKEGNKYTKDL